MDVPDELGADFPSLQAAREHACDQARNLAGETIIETGRIVLDHRIDIEDERGAVLDTVHFRDVLQIDGRLGAAGGVRRGGA